MSSVRYKAKVNGLTILKGKWFKAWLILVIIFLLDAGISALENGYRTAFNIPLNLQAMIETQKFNITPESIAIAAVFAFLSFLLVTPLDMGQTEWYWNLSDSRSRKPASEPDLSQSFYTPGASVKTEDDAKLSVNTIFAWFSSARLFFKSILLNLNIFIRSLLWSILICAIPSAMLGGAYYIAFNYNSLDYQIIAAFLLLGGSALLLGAMLLLLYVLSKYYLAVYLFVEDNSRGTNAVISESIRLSKGYRMEIVKFVLSFFGWFLLRGVLIVTALYVDPYYNASSVIFARHIIFTRRAEERGSEDRSGAGNGGRDTMEFHVDSN